MACGFVGFELLELLGVGVVDVVGVVDEGEGAGELIDKGEGAGAGAGAGERPGEHIDEGAGAGAGAGELIR